MIELFRIAWEFVRRPTFALDEYVKKWPTNTGFWLLVLSYAGAQFGSAKSMNVSYDFFIGTIGKSSAAGLPEFYLFGIFTGLLGIALAWKVYPQLIKLIYSRKPREVEFDEDLCRRLICYAQFPLVVTTVCVTLPISVVTKPLTLGFINHIDQIRQGGTLIIDIIFLLFVLPLSLALVIWILACAVASFAMQWKGLTLFFGFSSKEKIIGVFVIPLIAALPGLLFLFPRMIKFFQSYPAFHQ